MGKNKKPKTPAQVAASAPTTLDEAAKSAAKIAAQKKAVRANKKRILEEGGRQVQRTVFHYADGRIVTIPMQLRKINKLDLPIVGEDNAVVVRGKSVQVIDTKKTKAFQYSFISRVQKSGVNKGKYRREWEQCQVPADAREIDLMFNAKQWKSKPEMIKVNGKPVLIGTLKNAAVKNRKAKFKKPKPIEAPVG